MKSLIPYLSITSLMIISLLFILFTYYTSDNSNVDLNYYINISKNFHYSIYNSEANIYVDNILKNSLSKHYLIPQMYFVYSVLFQSDLSAAYFLLNTLIYCLLILSIANVLINIYLKDIKIWWRIILLLTINFVAISSFYINVPAGNLAMQSLVLLMLFSNIKRNDWNITFVDFMPFLGMVFFSSTGLLTSLVPTIVLCLIYTYKNRWIKSLNYWPIPLFVLFINVFVFTNIFSNKILFIIAYYLLILGQVFLLSIIKIFYRKTTTNLKINIPQNNIIYSSVVIVFLLTVFISMFNMLYLQELVYYENKYSYMYMSMMLMALVVFSIEWWKDHKFNSTIIVLLIVNLISTLEYLLGSLVIRSASMWRLIYLLPGMGNITDSVIIYFILVICLFRSVMKINWFKKISTLQISKNKVFINISLLIIAALVSIFSMTASYTSLFTYNTNMSLSKNVKTNLNIISKSDIDILKKIDFDNWNNTYITDMMIYQYLDKATDLTSFLNYSINDKEFIPSYHWNYSSFYSGINYWNSKYKNNQLQKTPDLIERMIKNLIVNISTFNIKNTNQNEIKKLNYMILSKHNPYSYHIIDAFKQTYNFIDGKDIIVFNL